jgi:hypothetical protein
MMVWINALVITSGVVILLALAIHATAIDRASRREARLHAERLTAMLDKIRSQSG